MAIQFDVGVERLGDRDVAAALLQHLAVAVPVIKHASRRELPDALAVTRLSADRLETLKVRDAAVQVGTVGRGNHFVELQGDEEDRLWVMVHSGSRGIGPAIRDHHLREAKRTRAGLRFLDAETEDGQAYLHDMQWALGYADWNRRAILRAVYEVAETILGGHPIEDSAILCHHNHVVRECVGGRMLWLHRKGAISAKEGEIGVIPGSMASPSYHVCGRGSEVGLLSSSHGAGRAMSRTDARRHISVSDLEGQMHGVWFDHRRSRDLVDEAPAAYKDINKVMRAQKELTKIVRRLRPIVSYKGG